uniref:Transmembrane protein n=6 Tax=Toxoplasma gondii TaxID=5811 RepID=A0A0F7V803_TOXGV|nr:TPA: hypothetical protein BN1205_107700 [Toxoplasma gondii VEG]
METQWIHTLAAASASPPSSSLLRQTGPTQTSLRRKTSTTRRRERTRWRDRGNTPVHRLYPFLISLTALAAALVFLKHFYTTCVIGSRAPLRSSTLTTFTFPPSFPSSPSIPSSPLPLQLSSGSASTGPLHRRLAETPWRDTQHGAPTICQTDDDRGGENSSDRQGHSESAETQTRGQGGGTGEEGSSNSRRRRRRPVHEAGEDERKDGDTIGTTHGDASPTESELAPSSKRKRHTFQDEEVEDEIDTDPLLGEEAAILSFESENLGLAAPERNPCNGLSELELESLLFQQHLIPKHGEILAFFSFSTKLYRSLKSDIRRRIRIAVGPKGKTGSVGTLLRKLAVAIFLSRQFEWIQSSLPPHIRHYVETKDQKAHAALKQTIREVLFDLLGNTREDCLHAVQVELLRTALAASRGAYVEDTHWHRDITLRDLDEDDYTEMLKTHANELTWAVSGRQPLADLRFFMRQRQDIDKHIPETSLLKRAIKPVVFTRGRVSFSLEPLPHPLEKDPNEHFKTTQRLAPFVTDVIRPPEVPAATWATVFTKLADMELSNLRQLRCKIERDMWMDTAVDMLRVITLASQTASEATIVALQYPASPEVMELSNAARRLTRSVDLTCEMLGVAHEDGAKLKQILAAYVSENSRAIREESAGQDGPKDPTERLYTVLRDTVRATQQMDLAQVLIDAMAADEGLFHPPSRLASPGILRTFLESYHPEGEAAAGQTGLTGATQQTGEAVAALQEGLLGTRRERARAVSEAAEAEVEEPESAGTDGRDTFAHMLEELGGTVFFSGGKRGQKEETSEQAQSLRPLHRSPEDGKEQSTKEGQSGQGHGDGTGVVGLSVAHESVVSAMASTPWVPLADDQLGSSPIKKARTDEPLPDVGEQKGTASSSVADYVTPLHKEQAHRAGDDDDFDSFDIPAEWIFDSLMALEDDDAVAAQDEGTRAPAVLPALSLLDDDSLLDSMVALLDASEEEVTENDDVPEGATD